SFALALRASDACWLDVTDLAPAGHGGLDVTIRLSKTDQEGSGEVLALAPGVRAQTCPVRALQAWVDSAGIGGDSGPLFRSVGKGARSRIGETRMARSSVRLILRRAADRAGVSLEGLSPHSLRRSFATEGYKAGVSERELARTGRWASVTTMRGYDASSRWADPASARLGL
ncbi:MAG: Integrase/recombinase, partial [Modestobacter sp.]|nr:Integrase/recombinase [Modestobacter sp.]